MTTTIKKAGSAIDLLQARWEKDLAALTPQLMALAPSMSAAKIEEHARKTGLYSLYDLRNSITRNNERIAALS